MNRNEIALALFVRDVEVSDGPGPIAAHADACLRAADIFLAVAEAEKCAHLMTWRLNDDVHCSVCSEIVGEESRVTLSGGPAGGDGHRD